MTYETFVSIAACCGIAAFGGWMVWFPAAKVYQGRRRREEDHAAATRARLDEAMPLPASPRDAWSPGEIQAELLRFQAAALDRALRSQVADPRWNAAEPGWQDMRADHRGLPTIRTTVEPAGENEHSPVTPALTVVPDSASTDDEDTPGRRRTPAEALSAFDDPPHALPRVRDDRGESVWGVLGVVVVVLVGWSLLSGQSIKGLAEDALDVTTDAIATVQDAFEDGEVPPTPWDDAENTSSDDRHDKPAGDLTTALGRVEIAEPEDVDGYSRDEFGPSWTDEYDGPGGHNDCRTRDDVLAAQLSNVKRPDECAVVAGTLADPYTGRTIHFDVDHAEAVQIDHVYPLSAAWDAGAAEWSEDKRRTFANDTKRNLLASDGPTNMAKGDSTPGEWMPPNKAFQCSYLRRFLVVADHYDLTIAPADAAVVRDQSPRCGSGDDRGRS